MALFLVDVPPPCSSTVSISPRKPRLSLQALTSTNRAPRCISARFRLCAANSADQGADEKTSRDEEEVKDLGVRAALCMLKFYKREISPLLPSSCRYVPTCSEYSMEAYKKYGVAKGTILTAWRLCRCNPFGGSGFDPPRWFGEDNLSK